MSSPTTSSRWLLAAAVPVGLLASGLVVWQASYAAFTATTVNENNTFSAGEVVLTDNDAGVAMFTAADNDFLVPGSTGSQCIDVTYAGNVDAEVKLYAAYVGTPNDLAPFLDFEVQVGPAGTACAITTPVSVFTGTLANLVSTHTNFGNGISTWTPTGAASETRRYLLTYTVNANTPDTAQNDGAVVSFTWEAQSTTPVG